MATNLNFKTAFKPFYTPATNMNLAAADNTPDEDPSSSSKLDEKTVQRIVRLKHLESKREASASFKNNTAELNPSAKELLDSNVLRYRWKYKFIPEMNSKSYTMYICLLKKSTDEMKVVKYFEEFGPVFACCIEREKHTGASSGCGYVIFKLPETLDIVLSASRFGEGCIIDGQKIICCAINCSQVPSRGRRLFLSVPHGIEIKALKKYFEDWTQSKVRISIRQDPTTNSNKGYGFVTFSSSFTMHYVLKNAPLFVKGKPIHVEMYNERQTESLASRKLIIWNLSIQTTEETLKSYFQKFGLVECAVVMKTKNSKISRGFGYVIFEWTAPVYAVSAASACIIDGSCVMILQSEENKESEMSRLLVVTNLDVQTSEDTIIYYFEMYGEVETCIIERDDSGKSKGSCRVIFEQSEILNRVLSAKHHEIDFQEVVCLPGTAINYVIPEVPSTSNCASQNYKEYHNSRYKSNHSSKSYAGGVSGKELDPMKILEDSRKFSLPKINMNDLAGSGVNLFKDRKLE